MSEHFLFNLSKFRKHYRKLVTSCDIFIDIILIYESFLRGSIASDYIHPVSIPETSGAVDKV